MTGDCIVLVVFSWLQLKVPTFLRGRGSVCLEGLGGDIGGESCMPEA